VAVPENAAPAISQVHPGKTSEQTDLVSNESSKKTGLMESSLGSLLQEVRPLRDQSRGRLNASLSRGETASIAISGQESSKIVAGAQNEDSHPSFASKQENGFSALQSDAATNGANSAINATPFETALESGMHGSLTAQQGNQPLQAASVEPGSIRLASGEFMSENQIVNQVMDRIAVERSGNLNRIVVKMNPEELGEVKLALTMEKDQLRAQLLTQNQQVQEILQKHLPKLHEALSQQGLKLEDIQVGVDSNRHSDQGAFANHRQPDSFRRHFNAPAGISNNVPVQPAIGSARSVSNQGLSLRI
jgi:flagellar hook-length control protein FliK